MQGEKDRFGLQREPLDLSLGVEAIQKRHSYVDQRDIGAQLFRQFHRLMTVPCLRRHLEALPLEKEFQALANKLMVIREKDGLGLPLSRKKRLLQARAPHYPTAAVRDMLEFRASAA